MRAWAWVPWQHSAVRPRSLPRWGLGEAAAQRSHATAASPVARAVGVRLRTPAHRALLGTPRRRTGPTMMARTTTGAHLLASGQCGSYGAIGTCGHAASLAALVRRLSTRGHAAALGKQVRRPSAPVPLEWVQSVRARSHPSAPWRCTEAVLSCCRAGAEPGGVGETSSSAAVVVGGGGDRGQPRVRTVTYGRVRSVSHGLQAAEAHTRGALKLSLGFLPPVGACG